MSKAVEVAFKKLPVLKVNWLPLLKCLGRLKLSSARLVILIMHSTQACQRSCHHISGIWPRAWELPFSHHFVLDFHRRLYEPPCLKTTQSSIFRKIASVGIKINLTTEDYLLTTKIQMRYFWAIFKHCVCEVLSDLFTISQ